MKFLVIGIIFVAGIILIISMNRENKEEKKS